MVSKRWTTSSKCVYNIGYHLIWCTKYRRDLLKEEEEAVFRKLALEKAKELGVQICSMEVMPEHVHLFVKCSPSASPHWIVQQIKGYTSNRMRKQFKHLTTRVPNLWTRSYYCESVGHISEETIRKYIEEQKNV
jgi:putative transposase